VTPAGELPILRVEGLTKRFGKLTAVSDVSFEIPTGMIFGLLGPNGSGKSTIIRMLCGLLRPSAGTVVVDGVDVVAEPDAVKPHIGYMSQRFSLYRDLTVHENMTFYGRVYGLGTDRLARRREEVTELVGIGDYMQRLSANLSGGWQQRLALACCLLHEPRVVFLDEPTAGIDPVARRQLWDLLFELSGSGTTFLVTTHYMDEAERCGEVGYLYLSKLITRGDPQALTADPSVNPPGARWVQIECDHSPRAYLVLRDSPGVLRATIFGRSLHMLVSDELSNEELVERLNHRDISVSRTLAVTPSLEDVFVSLTELHARRAE